MKPKFFTTEINIYRDGNSEIIDDSANPAYEYMGQIKRKVFLAMTVRQQEEFEKLKGLDKQLYARKLALEVIQEKPVDDILGI